MDDFGFKEWSIIYQDDGRQNKISHYNTSIKGKRVRVDCDEFVNRYCICSQGFDTSSNVELQKSLSSVGIDSSLSKVKGGYGKQVVISRATSKAIFYTGIKDHVIASMKYKLSAKPHLAYNG